jgi:hypothetical protein
MVDLKLQVPATDKVEVNSETLAAIDRGIKDETRAAPSPSMKSLR